MRKILQSLTAGCLLAAAVPAQAQDIIVKSNGDEVQAKVRKVSEREIEYVKWSNPDGPVYTVSTASVFMIKYENGEKDVFGNSAAAAPAQPEPAAAALPVEPMSEEARKQLNDEIRARYNVDCVEFTNEKKKGKKPDLYYAQFYATEGAEFADEAVQVSYTVGHCAFEKDKVTFYPGTYTPARAVRSLIGTTLSTLCPAVEITVANKSDHTVYVDLGNSFMSYDGEAKSLYVPTATSTTQGGSKGVGVNLGSVAGALGVGGAVGQLAGGVNVGGSRSQSTTSVTYSQRVISIPPKSLKKLEPQVLLPDFDLSEKANSYLPASLQGGHYLFEGWGKMRTGEKAYFEDLKVVSNEMRIRTIYSLRWGTHLSYAFTEDCAALRSLHADFYVRKVLPVRSTLGVVETDDLTIGQNDLHVILY